MRYSVVPPTDGRLEPAVGGGKLERLGAVGVEHQLDDDDRAVGDLLGELDEDLVGQAV